jgi:hypothetical protein
MTRLAWVAWLALSLAACDDGATTLLLEISGPSELTRLDFSLSLDGATPVKRTLALAGQTRLPATALVELPDRAVGVTIDVEGHGAASDLFAHAFVISQPHAQVRVPLVLAPSSDLGVPDAGSDAAADLAVETPDAALDLAASDLRYSDLRPPSPVARLISTSYRANDSLKSPSGMSQTGYAINTTGVVDGDLLLIIANVDNGSSSVWPTPMAPGFAQLAEVFFGSDGQTYVVQWKIASSEPAQYTGSYGSGVGSSAAVIALIAVSNVNPVTPINTFLNTNGPSEGDGGQSPVIATTPGVTTTVPGCAIIYAAGADWLGGGGSNSFTLPSGFTSLAQLGDHGDSNWEWTSEMVGWSVQPGAGPTGTIAGTLNSSVKGIPWTAVIAVAPR